MTIGVQVTGLGSAKRIVVKIGSSLLVAEEDGTVRRDWLDSVATDIAALRHSKREVVVVSSGAVAVGRRLLGLPAGVLRLEEKQAAAAAGQVLIANAWQQALAERDIPSAQVLLTLDDSEDRRRYLNATNTLTTLLRLRAVPVINENDTVATQELRFGDNDRLAARVAQMVSADTLVLMSDIDGLYTADPRTDPDAVLLREIGEITPEIEAMAGVARSTVGSGGMITKLIAARIALGAGCRMAIVSGKRLNPLAAIESHPCSWFLPTASPRTARKHWIAGTLRPVGTLVVDAGAQDALGSGKSLLPAGIVAVEGDFQRGDPVVVASHERREIARGLSAYSAEDARRIMGHKSREIEAILGYRGRDAVIHRDDLALT